MQKPNMLQRLVKCAIRGAGKCPSGLKFFKNLISLPAMEHVVLTGLQGGYDNSLSDLEIGVPCSRLRNLTLYACDLLTSETALMIQSCPELLKLEITWYDDSDGSHGQSSEPDHRLQFGVIADAITAYTPKLTALRLRCSRWSYRYVSTEYPYTIGTSLQPLKHLKKHELDHHMIYGWQRLEELSPNNYGVRPIITSWTLGQALSKSIESLAIEASEFIHTSEEDVELSEEWQDWQIKDLIHFLADESFERVCMIVFSWYPDTRRVHIDAEVVRKHGWEVLLIGLKGEWSCKLENKGRGGDNGA